MSDINNSTSASADSTRQAFSNHYNIDSVHRYETYNLPDAKRLDYIISDAIHSIRVDNWNAGVAYGEYLERKRIIDWMLSEEGGSVDDYGLYALAEAIEAGKHLSQKTQRNTK